MTAAYRSRAPVADDAESVGRVVNACTVADVGMAAVTPQELADRWSRRAGDFEVVASGEGEVVAYLETESDAGFYFEGYVHPQHAGRGVGAHLVAAAERRAAPREGDAKVTTNVGNAAARRLMELKGYACTAHEYAMFAELERLPAPAAPPAGIELRPFVPGADERALHEVMTESFGDGWTGPRDPEPWMRAHLEHKAYDPSLWIFAADGEEVAGAVMCRSFWGAQEDVGWVKNLAVRPRWRRQGIGRALLFHAFDLLRAAGRTRVVLGVDAANPTGAPSFYRALGMRVGGETWDYEKRLRRA